VERPTTCASPVSPGLLLVHHARFASSARGMSISTSRGVRTATPAERVRLVVALSETGGTLRWEAISLDVYGKAREYGVLIVNGR